MNGFEIRQLSSKDTKLAPQYALSAHAVTHNGGGVGWTAENLNGESAMEKVADYFRKRLDNPLVSLYIAENKDGDQNKARILGSVQLIRNDPFHSCSARHRAFVSKLFVHPQERGQGLSRKMMERLISDARAEGLTQVCLDVRLSENQAAARGLYLSLGFVVYGTHENYASVGQGSCSGWYMLLDL